MFADSSSERATCSTIWLGDHFPGARGDVQALFVRSPAMINCSIASLLASRAVLISAIGPPFPEECSGRSYSSSSGLAREPFDVGISDSHGMALQSTGFVQTS